MRNLLLGFLKQEPKINKKGDTYLPYVNIGQVQKTEPSNVKRLAAKLQIDEACVVFYATYDDHAGHCDNKPTIVMLHWAKARNNEFRLAELLKSAANEEQGIGSLNDIRVYIVSHPRNTVGLENDIREAIGKISKELSMAFQSEKKRFEYDDDIKDGFDIKKIECKKFDEFEINNMTALPENIEINLSVRQNSSESPRRLL